MLLLTVLDVEVRGQLVPDPKTFPSGIKALADYVHGISLIYLLWN